MVKDILNLSTENTKDKTFSRSQLPDAWLEPAHHLGKDVTHHFLLPLEDSECCLGTLSAHVNCVTLNIDWSKPEPRVPLSEPESRWFPGSGQPQTGARHSDEGNQARGKKISWDFRPFLSNSIINGKLILFSKRWKMCKRTHHNNCDPILRFPSTF